MMRAVRFVVSSPIAPDRPPGLGRYGFMSFPNEDIMKQQINLRVAID
jgi:hypothetical protein